jgi:anaerobic ribonucleoside-triphosphate reductase activating protein
MLTRRLGQVLINTKYKSGKMVAINLFRLAFPVSSLGPGERIVLWVAGCKRSCTGCMSLEMQNPLNGRQVPVRRLADYLLKLPHELSGITISGGEPFDQAEELAFLINSLWRERPEWNVLIYSGYTLQQLRAVSAGRCLLALADILVDGEFQQNIPRTHPLAGSGNQRVIALTKRGKTMKKIMNTVPFNQLNLGVGQGSENILIGVTDEAVRSPLRRMVKVRVPENQ